VAILLMMVLPGCRCAETSPYCTLDGNPLTLPTAASDPRGVTLAQHGEETAAAWIEGMEEEGAVVVSRLNQQGKPFAAPLRLGRGGSTPLLVRVAVHQGKLAVTWVAGSRRLASLHAAIISRDGKAQTMALFSQGKLAHPTVAFVHGDPWVVWSAGGAVQARRLTSPDTESLQLADPRWGAYSPMLRPMGNKVVLAYASTRSNFDLHITRAYTVPALAKAHVLRVPRQLHLLRKEPAMVVSSDQTAILSAWSQVPVGKGLKYHQVLAAQVNNKGEVKHFQGALQGLRPAVAPGAAGTLAVAWLQPTEARAARLFFGLLSSSSEPITLPVERTDLRLGRAALVAVGGGYTLLWTRRAKQGYQRQLRVARITCGP